jgi:hypothetical protein
VFINVWNFCTRSFCSIICMLSSSRNKKPIKRSSNHRLQMWISALWLSRVRKHQLLSKVR